MDESRSDVADLLAVSGSLKLASTMSVSIRIAARVPCTTAEGPGLRYALWLQGCTLRCPGCCNPEMFSIDGGSSVEVESLVEETQRAAEHEGVEGITILGGEPLEQLEAVTRLAEGLARLGLGVLVFTGYRLEEAVRHHGFGRLWCSIDTLVDGRFDGRALPAASERRRFVGSTNQRLLHRTPRYADPVLWREPEECVDVLVGPGGEVTIVGAVRSSARLVTELRTARAHD